jgi:ABC-type transport system substrate-binding protein
MVKASFFLMRLLLFIFIILMSGMLSTAFAGPVKADNGLIYCSERDITHMNPQRYNVSSMASSISFAVYDRLMTLDPKTKAIKNSIGSLERIYNNDTVYIFNIQEGIRFHSNSYFTPTRELNAYDVAFSFDRIINPNNPFYRPIDDFPYIAHLDIVKNLVSVKAISDHQVEFTVNQPTNLLLPFLATDNSVILSEEYAEKILEKHLPIDTLDHYAIGSGPYHQTDFVRGRYAKLSLFLSYHDKLPKIQKLVLTNSYKANKLLYKLFTEECHIISNPTAVQKRILRRKPQDFNIVQKHTINATFIIYNTRKPYLNTGALRRTLSSMFDLQELNTTVFFDQGHYIVDLFGDTSSDILHQNMQKELQNEKSQPITSTDLSEITEKDEEEKPDNRSFKPGERIIGNTVHGYINNQFNEAIPEYAIPMAELQDGLDPELMPHDLTAQEYKEAYQILRRQPIEITIFQSNVIANTAHSKIAQFLKSNFEKNGIRTTIKNYRNTRGINNLKRGNFDMAIVNVFSDSTSLIFPLISCKKDFIKQRNNSLNSNLNYFENYTGWCNEKLDNMHESLSFLDRNDSDAVQLRKFIKNILVNEMPIYPLVYNINQFVSLEYVKGLESTPSGGVSFINAYLEKPAKKKKRKQVQNYQGTPLTEETTQKTDGEVQK